MNPIPAVAGIGLKPQHFAEILGSPPAVGWFELHPENYMVPGGALLQQLDAIREDYPLSFHGVGLSLGSSDILCCEHLARLQQLIDRYQPALVSEHLSWSGFGGAFYNDLLPLPYDNESLCNTVAKIQQVQDSLQRQILIENPAAYLAVCGSTYGESQFLVELARRSGCGILLDVNNVFVCAQNQGFDAGHYLQEIPGELILEVHLAGHTIEQITDGDLLIDDHGSRVCHGVWQLYQTLVDRIGCVPTLIEWDTNVPEFSVLCEEAAIAQALLDARHDRAAALELV